MKRSQTESRRSEVIERSSGLRSSIFDHRSAKITPARRTAFEILYRVGVEQAYASNLLASNLTAKLSREDRSLAYEIVLGVLRHQLYIDYFIEQSSGRKLGKLDIEVLIALRMGFHQIQNLTRLPPHAVVNESVNLVKAVGKASAGGFVNAVLRKALKTPLNEESITLRDPIRRESIRRSHPLWLFERWAARYGIEWAGSLAESNNAPAPLSFRINMLAANPDEVLTELKQAGLEIVSSAIALSAYRLAGGDPEKLLEAASRGLIHIQDESSQLIASLIDARPDERILDVCAAPGGKTTALAASMENRGLIAAGDLRHSRLKTVMDACRRLGVSIVHPICCDASLPLPFSASFDRVLVDAPCTGTGTLRRNPEIKWRLSIEKIREMAALQRRILENAALLVADGGRIVYSTCSLEEEENESPAKDFLDSHPEFRIFPPDVPEILRTDLGFIRIWPNRDGADGFFAAVFEKR